MKLSIVIPAFNEEARLGVTLSLIADAWSQARMHDLDLMEVIVVDDGSSDGTLAVARKWSGSLPVVTIDFRCNRGKGAAVRAGALAAHGDLILMYDADSATPITEVNNLFGALIRDGSDIAIGSRVSGGGSLVSMSSHRRIIGRIYHSLCSRLVPGIHDTACGCKLFRIAAARKLFSRQRINRFAFDVEVLALALRWGYRISEVPVRWTAVPESKVRLLKDGPQMFASLIVLYVQRIFCR